MGKWEMVPFDEVFLDETKKGTKIMKESYLPIGNYPIVDQGKEQIAGYSDESKGLYRDVPAIIFGDHTRIIKYIDTPFFLGADGVKLLRSKKKDVDHSYLYYCLSTAQIPDTGYNRHYKWLKELYIPIPPLPVQHRIANVLDRVNALIAKRKAQIEKLDLLVKYRFIEMFGDPMTNPKGWEVRRLGNCCIANPQKKELDFVPDHTIVSFIGMTNVSETGAIDTSNQAIIAKVCNTYTYFAENDVLFAKITPCMENGKGAIARNLINQIGFGSTEFHVLRPISNISNSEWLFHLTRLDLFRKSAEKNMSGSAGQKRVPIKFIEKFLVPLPPLSLQNQFADFVREVDKSKFALRQSLEKMERNYKSLMQKCFRGEIF